MHFQLNILLPHSGKSTRLIALHCYVDPDTCTYLRRGLIGSLANGYIAVIRTKSVTHVHSAPRLVVLVNTRKIMGYSHQCQARYINLDKKCTLNTGCMSISQWVDMFEFKHSSNYGLEGVVYRKLDLCENKWWVRHPKRIACSVYMCLCPSYKWSNHLIRIKTHA